MIGPIYCMSSSGHLGVSIPRWQGSAQCCTAVGEYIAMAVGVIVVLPSFRRPRPFYLEETTQHQSQFQGDR